MYRLKLHIYFFVFFLSLLLISLVFNIGIMGVFFGTLLALISDPIVLFFGFFSGLLFLNLRHFLYAFLASALSVNLIAEFLKSDWHFDIGYSGTSYNLFFIIFVRSIAVLMLSVLSNMIRVYFFNRK